MTPKEFIAAIGPVARQAETISRVPASFVIADAALESGFGSSALAQKAFNLFGVKADPSWSGPVLSMPTREFINGEWKVVDAKWRQYSDWLGSIQDHAAFLWSNPRYRPAFATTTAEDFARAVAAAGYATDPQYAEKIIKIMHADLSEGPSMSEPKAPNSSANTAIATVGATGLLSTVLWVCNTKLHLDMPPDTAGLLAAGLATAGHAVWNKWIRPANQPFSPPAA